jgi:hypothetical protein
MSDVVFLLGSIAFFAASVLYSAGCDRLKGGRDDA